MIDIKTFRWSALEDDFRTFLAQSAASEDLELSKAR
jgi:hypothetical protein